MKSGIGDVDVESGQEVRCFRKKWQSGRKRRRKDKRGWLRFTMHAPEGTIEVQLLAVEQVHWKNVGLVKGRLKGMPRQCAVNVRKCRGLSNEWNSSEAVPQSCRGREIWDLRRETWEELVTYDGQSEFVTGVGSVR